MQSSYVNSPEPRLLQSSNGQGGTDILEFLGFVAWYLFLVMCCLIPTVCAYHRRRNMMMAQHHQNQMHQNQQAQLFLTNFHFSPRMEEGQTEANQIIPIQEALQKTTMLVDQNDLVRRDEDSDRVPAESSIQEKETGQEEKETEEKKTRADHKNGGDVEMGELPSTEENEFYLVEDTEREFSHLQLPQDTTNGARLIPAACAICLGPYEAGDLVSWSPELACQHAFHRDCITSWLSKKPQHLCPCCRQEFIRLEQTTEENNVVIVPVTHEGLSFGAQYPPAMLPTDVRGVAHYHVNL
jgi:hypothetical protein